MPAAFTSTATAQVALEAGWRPTTPRPSKHKTQQLTASDTPHPEAHTAASFQPRSRSSGPPARLGHVPRGPARSRLHLSTGSRGQTPLPHRRAPRPRTSGPPAPPALPNPCRPEPQNRPAPWYQGGARLVPRVSWPNLAFVDNSNGFGGYALGSVMSPRQAHGSDLWRPSKQVPGT